MYQIRFLKERLVLISSIVVALIQKSLPFLLPTQSETDCFMFVLSTNYSMVENLAELSLRSKDTSPSQNFTTHAIFATQKLGNASLKHISD